MLRDVEDDEVEGGELIEERGDREDSEREGEGAVVNRVPGATTTVTMPACAAAVSSMSLEPGKYVLCSRGS